MGNIKTDNKVAYGKIKIPQEPHIFKSELNDGSFRALIYDKHKTDVNVRFSEEKFYDHGAGCYRLSYRCVPNVIERKLLYTILIIRKSAHVFVVIISSDKSTEYQTVKTYDEINEIITPLFKKKKNT